MKYVLLGNLSPEWASKQSERIGKAKAKLDKLACISHTTVGLSGCARVLCWLFGTSRSDRGADCADRHLVC
jgi:hypothetical protein